MNTTDRTYKFNAKSVVTVTLDNGIKLIVEPGIKSGIRRTLYGTFLLASNPWFGSAVFILDLLIGFYIDNYTPGELETFVATTPFALSPPQQTQAEMLLLYRFAEITLNLKQN